LELEILKTVGPAGMGVFAGYLIVKEVANLIRQRRNGNGNGNGTALTNSLLTQKVYEILIELRSESKRHTELLKELVRKDCLKD
jgi:hypothetical protein